MPLRYGVEGLQDIMLRGYGPMEVVGEITVLVCFFLTSLVLARSDN